MKAMQDVPMSRLDASLLHLLHRAGQVADELFTSEMTESDLTPRQYAVLAALAKHQTASQTTIVDETGIDRSTVAEIVKRLLHRGVLARRRAKHDARAYAVRLTPAGQAALRQAEPIAQRVNDRLLKQLGTSRRAEILDALSTIVNSSDPRRGKSL
jgi:DNA-binding MarR family transcriptional regulator